MNSNPSSISNNKPDLSSWIASGISICLVFVLCVSLTIQLEDTRIKNGAALIDEGTDVIENLYRLESPQGLARYFYRNKRLAVISELNSVNKALLNRDYKTAESILEKMADSNELSAQISELGRIESEVSKAVLEKNNIEIAIEEEKEKFKHLSTGINAFFGLKTPENLIDIRFYEKGVLQGLPVIEKLPDDIADLQIFSNNLTSIGGKIELEGIENPVEYFQGKLEEFRDQAFNISLSYTGYEEKLIKVSKSVTKMEELAKNKRQQISKILNGIALNITNTSK